MRREWRRTSSSQAEPSPWRQCWTSWASCSNVSSASKPGAVTCATTSGQFLVKPQAALLGLPYYGTKSASEMFPNLPLAASDARILLSPPEKHNKCPGWHGPAGWHAPPPPCHSEGIRRGCPKNLTRGHTANRIFSPTFYPN